MNLRILALAAALCLPTLSRADAWPAPPSPRAWEPPARRPIGLLLRMGLDFGGDKIMTATYTDGKSDDVKAGGLVHLAGGLIVHPDAPVAVEATFGYKVDDATAKNGQMKFDRLPIDLVVSYVAAGRHRIGLGPTLHLSPKATCSIDNICSGTVRYSSAVGVLGQYAFEIPAGSSGFELGARFTSIRYSSNDPRLRTLDGSSFGVFFGGWL